MVPSPTLCWFPGKLEEVWQRVVGDKDGEKADGGGRAAGHADERTSRSKPHRRSVSDENIRLRLVEVPAVNSNEALPLVYDPDIIASYWGKRPRAVSTRIIQLLSVAGGFLSHLAWDLINKKIAEVPSFPDDVVMALIEEELGQPWCKIYSELTPSPIAAASLGQVYKGCLKETGELVAVKVQRPFVLETVTIDLFIIRKLGLFLRRFPQDEWAARIFEELDYVNEGENGTRFAEMMREDLPQV
nr:PREDICTED: uncharacterized protein LOC103998790 [Musa acuminata subsp. malaccensis]